ncbi:ankyrin repeat domain-containing protein 2 isoform X2 [Acipenser ruthenus]|uniref:ankyrin repeat domain-containing protein 2 isoform X2 n=1 Tax=Acipenser ruthenus TaxID=7906 RepID=UPI0027404203|nr:ankyrin repeat domain-containing protein 2 isoform X2 [Acipenser ruthenus]
MDTAELEEEKYSEPKIKGVIKIQAEERVRKTSSDLRREIIDLGSIHNFTELRKMRKNRKKKEAPAPEMEPEEITGPIDVPKFLKAAVKGKIKIIEKFLEDGGNPDSCDEFKRTALQWSSLKGHTEIVQKLLDKGANANFRDRLDCTAVHWACRGGRLDALKSLQNSGADLNVKDKLMSSPLHVATRTGRYDVVEHLIASGINVNAKDREGDTALHDAVRLNRYKIVKLLIIHGANMMAKNAVSERKQDPECQLVDAYGWEDPHRAGEAVAI